VKKQQGMPGRGGWIFLAVVAACYGLVALLDGDRAAAALRLSARLMGEMAPVLGVVFVLLFVVHLLLDPKRVERYLGRSSGLRGWVIALLVGVLPTGPVYGMYAMLKELRPKGMRTSLMAALLYSRAVKLPLLPLLVHYFGLAYTVVLTGYILLFSVLGGVLMERLDER